jgi:membrane protein DedA with SNARE-associated domain
MINALIQWLGGLYHQFGYLIVFLGALGENTALVGLILPGGTLALLGAFYARAGTLNIGWVIFFAWIGTALGYHVDYLIGRFLLGRYAPAWSASRIGRRFRLAGRLRLGQRMLRKYGGRTIFISHAIGQLRSFVALSAGMAPMRYRRFLGYELVSALFWTGGYCLLGYYLGAQFQTLQTVIERGGLVLIGALVLAFLGWRLVRGRVRRRLAHSERWRALRFNHQKPRLIRPLSTHAGSGMR